MTDAKRAPTVRISIRVSLLVLVCVLIAVATCQVAGRTWTVQAPPRTSRREATEDFPAMASLAKRGTDGSFVHTCGAALLAPRYIVAGAHCVTTESGQVTDARWQVRLGSRSWRTGGTVAGVQAVTAHPDWTWRPDPPAPHADIALLRLDADVAASPFTIPPTVAGGAAPVRMIGWGVEPTGPYLPWPRLLELDGTLAAPSRCDQDKITDAEFCVEHAGGPGICARDSGGPVLHRAGGRWTLIGLLSHASYAGDRCAGSTQSVQTDLTWYRPWIAHVTGLNLSSGGAGHG